MPSTKYAPERYIDFGTPKWHETVKLLKGFNNFLSFRGDAASCKDAVVAIIMDEIGVTNGTAKSYFKSRIDGYPLSVPEAVMTVIAEKAGIQRGDVFTYVGSLVAPHKIQKVEESDIGGRIEDLCSNLIANKVPKFYVGLARKGGGPVKQAIAITRLEVLAYFGDNPGITLALGEVEKIAGQIGKDDVEVHSALKKLAEMGILDFSPGKKYALSIYD